MVLNSYSDRKWRKKMEIIIQFVSIFIAGILCFVVRDTKSISYILAACILVLVTISSVYHRLQEKKLENLILYLMKVQDRFELPDIEKYNEGKLGILQSEIYKLVVLFSEKSHTATKEREYLAKMLSDISHQIKTPLTSITIMTELLENPDLSEEKRTEFIGKIDQQVNRITWLIKNLLTLSQLEADMLKLKKEEILVKELLIKACQPFEIMAEVKNIALTVTTNEDIKLVCDSHWTIEAISNIVKNCIEHTEYGGMVSVYAEQNNFSTNIRITDNGEGIGKEHLPHIFERFYKGANSSTNSVGIGLAMSKQIIMQQNGTIQVTSEAGKGTSFFIKLYSDVKI